MKGEKLGRANSSASATFYSITPLLLLPRDDTDIDSPPDPGHPLVLGWSCSAQRLHAPRGKATRISVGALATRPSVRIRV